MRHARATLAAAALWLLPQAGLPDTCERARSADERPVG